MVTECLAMMTMRGGLHAEVSGETTGAAGTEGTELDRIRGHL